MKHRVVVSLIVVAVAGCGTAATSTVPSPAASVVAPGTVSPSIVAPQPSIVAPSPVAPARAEPVCADGAPPAAIAQAHHAKDGLPDPSGRIVFGRLTRVDDGLGQLVSINGIDPDGSDLAQILDCETERPRFSHDGARLVFSIAMSDGMFQVATSSVDGSNLQVIPSSTPGWADTVDWTADDSSFIYAFGDDMCVSDSMPCVLNSTWSEQLWQMDADGSSQRLIGNPDTLDWEPRVSPDGSEVVFNRWTDNTASEFSIWIRDLDTGEERQVRDRTNKPEHPDWSPDGEWIIYNTFANDGALEQIERIRADDPHAKPEVLYQDHGYKAAYSPDGSRIVFGCNGRLCVMNADGSDVRVLYEEQGVEINHFAWGVVPKDGG